MTAFALFQFVIATDSQLVNLPYLREDILPYSQTNCLLSPIYCPS